MELNKDKTVEFNFSQKQQLQTQLDQLFVSTQEIKSKLNGIDATERIAAECLQNITDTKKRLEECLLDNASMIEWQMEGLKRLGIDLSIDPTAPNKIHNLEQALQQLADENLNLKFAHFTELSDAKAQINKLSEKSDIGTDIQAISDKNLQIKKMYDESEQELQSWRLKYENLKQQLEEATRDREEIFEKYQTITGALEQNDAENYEVLYKTQKSNYESALQELSTLKKLYANAVDKLKGQVEDMEQKPETITIESTESTSAVDFALTSILEIGAIVENQNGTFGEVVGFENEGINVRHITGIKRYIRQQLRHLPGTNITIPQVEEVKLSANDFVAQNGIKKVTWVQVRDWSDKDKEKLRDLAIAGANTKSKKAKEFVASLPEKCAAYINETGDNSDLDWVMTQFRNDVEARMAQKPEEVEETPAQQVIPPLVIPSSISVNDIVMTEDQQIGTVIDLLPDNGAIVQIKEGEEKRYTLLQLTWLSSYVPEQKPIEPVIEVEINGAHQEFWKKYAVSTVAFKSLDWLAITNIIENSDTKLKELVSAAPASIQKKLNNGHLAQLLVAYIQESDNKSDLEWITEPLLTQVEELLAEAEIEEVEIEGVSECVEYELQSVARVAGKNGLWTVVDSKGSGWYTLKQGKDEVDAHASELDPLNVGF